MSSSDTPAENLCSNHKGRTLFKASLDAKLRIYTLHVICVANGLITRRILVNFNTYYICPLVAPTFVIKVIKRVLIQINVIYLDPLRIYAIFCIQSILLSRKPVLFMTFKNLIYLAPKRCFFNTYI